MYLSRNHKINLVWLYFKMLKIYSMCTSTLREKYQVVKRMLMR